MYDNSVFRLWHENSTNLKLQFVISYQQKNVIHLLVLLFLYFSRLNHRYCWIWSLACRSAHVSKAQKISENNNFFQFTINNQSSKQHMIINLWRKFNCSVKIKRILVPFSTFSLLCSSLILSTFFLSRSPGNLFAPLFSCCIWSPKQSVAESRSFNIAKVWLCWKSSINFSSRKVQSEFKIFQSVAWKIENCTNIKFESIREIQQILSHEDTRNYAERLCKLLKIATFLSVMSSHIHQKSKIVGSLLVCWF